MSEFDKALEATNKKLAELIIQEEKESFWEGIKFTIDTLQEAMQKSGLDYISPRWLDMIKREYEKS